MSNPVKQTALHVLHLELGARMVAFSGYEMPIQYRQGIKHEHEHTRTRAGLFDISHMGQLKILGESAAEVMETLVPSDITGLKPLNQRYTVLTNETGGIIDDLLITRLEEGLFLVVNAACKDNDIVHIKKALGPECSMEVMTEHSLLALQGPEASGVLKNYIPDIDQVKFFQADYYSIDNIDCFINRCGYTGEDGFEISVATKEVEQLARCLLSNEEVEPIGLGARDSLRLEAGLCLYGHDIDEVTTPVEANMSWVIAKKYRGEGACIPQFPGAENILRQLGEGSKQIRVGIRPEGKMPIREGTELLNENDICIGKITSGGFGQTVGGPVSMAYINREYQTAGTKLSVLVRGHRHTVRTSKLPFVEHRYFKT